MYHTERSVFYCSRSCLRPRAPAPRAHEHEHEHVLCAIVCNCVCCVCCVCCVVWGRVSCLEEARVLEFWARLDIVACGLLAY